ncbi:hypothetical protein HanXRQr2_Chr16g0769831 [Helianthus annuus]|uniref:Uncharacterized protein n=1 Tax=Helianthus annuus TaxID=4232 RepID=A0A251S2C7_HELAN|nr:hypothetical protein HanXRQr2_Chr16g0769831 [Helianthus annuus]KAJ0822943.1 hypothetical protein HanPSC8_Chr16g0737911 [Helianthus annuus]
MSTVPASRWNITGVTKDIAGDWCPAGNVRSSRRETASHVSVNRCCSFFWKFPILLVCCLQEIATQPMLFSTRLKKQARMALDTHFSN